MLTFTPSNARLAGSSFAGVLLGMDSFLCFASVCKNASLHAQSFNSNDVPSLRNLVWMGENSQNQTIVCSLGFPCPLFVPSAPQMHMFCMLQQGEHQIIGGRKHPQPVSPTHHCHSGHPSLCPKLQVVVGCSSVEPHVLSTDVLFQPE